MHMQKRIRRVCIDMVYYTHCSGEIVMREKSFVCVMACVVSVMVFVCVCESSVFYKGDMCVSVCVGM